MSIVRIFSGVVLALTAASLLGAAHIPVAVPSAGSISRLQGWDTDLNVFATKLPRRHANAFHHISRRSFDSEVAKLRQRLPTINADQFWVGLDQIESAIGDGHTFMRMPADAPRYGLDVKQFGSDYRVVAVAPAIRSDGVLGARIVAIDGSAISKVRERVLTLTPQDELQSLRDFRSQALLTNGLALHGLGVAASRDFATYQFEDDAGRRVSVILHAIPVASRAAWTTVQPQMTDEAGDKRMHCTVAGAEATVLCEFRSYDDLEHTSLQLFGAVRQNKAKRLIIDMRENNGGNFCKGLQHLVEPIAADPTLNRPGGLYVLIGQQTFSAAMSNAAHFRQLTHATLVGQPIGEKPNSYQEIEDLHLPYTGWDARYSSRFYRFAEGKENIIRPDVQTAATWNDYKQGKDPTLAYVLDQPMKKASTGQKRDDTRSKAAREKYCRGSGS